MYSQGVKTRASAALCWRLSWAEPVSGVAESQFSFESQAMLMDENRPMLMYCIDVSFLLTNFFSPCYNINAVWNRLFVVVKVWSPCVQKTIIFNLRWCTNCKYCTNEMLSAAQLPPKRKENGLFGLPYMCTLISFWDISAQAKWRRPWGWLTQSSRIWVLVKWAFSSGPGMCWSWNT